LTSYTISNVEFNAIYYTSVHLAEIFTFHPGSIRLWDPAAKQASSRRGDGTQE
jgi:hypothetical protein